MQSFSGTLLQVAVSTISGKKAGQPLQPLGRREGRWYLSKV